MSGNLHDKWHLLQAAMLDPELSKGAVITLARLLWYHNTRDADREHRCFPSYETVSRDLGCTRRQIIRNVEELNRLGWISVERRHCDQTRAFASNSFRFTFERATASEASEVVTPMSPPSDAHVTTPSDTDVTPLVTPMSPKEGNIIREIDTPPAGGQKPGSQKAKPVIDTEGPWTVFRSIYNRPGSNFKVARDLYDRAVKAGHDPERINEGARGYMAMVRAEGRDNSKIKIAETFLAAGKDYWLVDYGMSAKGGDQAQSIRPAVLLEIVRAFNEGGNWPMSLGPDPDSPGCRVPPEILQQARAAA